MLRTASLLAILIRTVLGASAQDALAAQERAPGTYYKLFTLEFEPGKTGDAAEILFETLVPA